MSETPPLIDLRLLAAAKQLMGRGETATVSAQTVADTGARWEAEEAKERDAQHKEMLRNRFDGWRRVGYLLDLAVHFSTQKTLTTATVAGSVWATPAPPVKTSWRRRY